MDQVWIKLKTRRKFKGAPAEIQINMDGTVYIDGKEYHEDSSEYENLTVDVENFNRMNSGEDTRKIMEQQKTAKKGETVTITDIKNPNRTESTIVKF